MEALLCASTGLGLIHKSLLRTTKFLAGLSKWEGSGKGSLPCIIKVTDYALCQGAWGAQIRWVDHSYGGLGMLTGRNYTWAETWTRGAG